MVSTFVLALFGAGLLAGGAALERSERYVAFVLSAVAAGLAGWLVASAAGAWSPLWIGLAAPAAWLIPTPRRTLLVALVSYAVSMAASLPTPGVLAWFGGALVLVAAELLCGRIWSRPADPASPAMGGAILVAALALFAALDFAALSGVVGAVRKTPATVLSLAISPGRPGERLRPAPGVAAWLVRSRYRRPTAAVAFFHGNDAAGSRQPAAFVLGRASVAAGAVIVLADHPGYGASRAPSSRSDPEAWEPLSAARAAMEAARGAAPSRPLFLIGHSMGCSDVLRLLGDGARPAGALMFGGSVAFPDSEDWRYRRFVSRRRMLSPIPLQLFREIDRRFYDNRELAARLARDHPPVAFVEFDERYEHADIVANRAPLFEAIPGSKRRLEFAVSDHYFNARRAGRYIVGDARTTRRLRHLLRDQFRTRPAPSDRPSQRP